MRTFWGRKGKPITLPCTLSIPVDKNFSLEWRKDNKLIMSAYGADAGHAAPSLQGSVARGGGLGLTIHSVSGDDAGRYHCVVTRFAKQPTRPEIGPPIRLVVNAAPTLIFPTNSHVNYGSVGESFSIECKADGFPPPEITWTKTNYTAVAANRSRRMVRVSTTCSVIGSLHMHFHQAAEGDKIVSTGPILRFEKLEKKDVGTYTCLAVNVEGRATSQVELKFSKVPAFNFVPTNKTAVEGSNVFWRCHADAEPSSIQYSWKFRDRPIKTTETGLRADIKQGDLSIRDIRKHDRGWYACSASNPSGEQSQATAFLDVLYSPEALPSHRHVLTIGYGQNGTLSCSVDANPKPSLYTWSKNGHFITTTTEDSLLIRGEKDTDGGIFGCQAENTVGRSPIIETHVIIAEPPAFITRPPPELKAFEGTSVEVPCEGFGDPLPIVYWIHSERRISSATLSIPSVSHADHGVYDCVVSNAVATIFSSMSLIVERSRPQAATIENVECAGEEAMVVNWTPGFNGSYAQSFVIHYASEKDIMGKSFLTSSTSATISDLAPFTKYRIHVESRNQKGSTNSSAVEKYGIRTTPVAGFIKLPGGYGRRVRCGTFCKCLVCSILPAPANIRLMGDYEIRWDPVDYARSYRVESRYDKMSAFKEIDEVVVPAFRMKPDYRAGQSFRVRSLRAPYEPSLPSQTLELGSLGSHLPSMWWAVFGGFLFFVIFITLYLYSKYGKLLGRRKRKSKRYNDYVCPSSFQPHAETIYEPTVIPAGTTKPGDWPTSTVGSEVRTRSEEMLEYCYAEGSTSAVDDMLRDKYMYGAEDVPIQLMNDLRIERLRREFKQSQL